MLTDLQLRQIEQDTFYYPLYQKYDLDYIKTAGFFFIDIDFSLNFDIERKILCTPTQHISKPTTNKHCIILTSGSMCPIHNGHIEIIEESKKYLENIGYEVLGGFIAPDHDSYVSRKNKDKHISIQERNKLVTNKIKEYGYQDWLALDPWYGTFAPCDLNFTTLIERLEFIFAELNTEIFFIAGGDNYKFANTFEFKGNCIIATRGNYDIGEITNKNNVHIINYGKDYSSTEARKYHNYVKPQKVEVTVRYSLEEPEIILSGYFAYIEHLRTGDQFSNFNELVQMHGIEDIVISLDSLNKTKNFLRVSRKYDIFGHTKFGYIINDDITSKLDPKVKYYLYDDDIHTGETIEHVIQYLKDKNIDIVNYFTMNYGTDEILDNRDFLVFWENNGLVIDGCGTRVPYIYPFVDPYIRCSVINPLQFSIDIWKQNLNLFKLSDKKLIDTEQRYFYNSLGFKDEQYCWEICEFYYNFLLGLVR